MKTKDIIYGVVGLGALYLGYMVLKPKKPSNKVNLTPVVNFTPIVNLPSVNTYSKQEATTKALVTVKDWIKTYDNLSADVLNQKTRSYLFNEKRLNDLKAKTNPDNLEKAEITFLTTRLGYENYQLKDRIITLKNTEYQNVYNVLKELYSQYPKSDVDKLMVLSPKYLSMLMAGDDFKYSNDLFQNMSIDDKLYLSDLDFYGKFEKIYEKFNPRQRGNATVTSVVGMLT